MIKTPELIEAERAAEAQLVLSILDRAPKSSNSHPKTLCGWVLPGGNALCSGCASRYIGRGFLLGRDSKPVWAPDVLPSECIGCDRDAKLASERVQAAAFKSSLALIQVKALMQVAHNEAGCDYSEHDCSCHIAMAYRLASDTLEEAGMS